LGFLSWAITGTRSLTWNIQYSNHPTDAQTRINADKGICASKDGNSVRSAYAAFKKNAGTFLSFYPGSLDVTSGGKIFMKTYPG
jgi:hypothetical protein